MTGREADENLQAESVSLDQGRWELDSLSGFEIPTLNEQQTPWLLFNEEEGTFSGYSGCNQLSGKYSSDQPGELQMGAIAMTRRFCPDTAQLEQTVVNALENANRHTTNNTYLKIFDGDKTLAIYHLADTH